MTNEYEVSILATTVGELRIDRLNAGLRQFRQIWAQDVFGLPQPQLTIDKRFRLDEETVTQFFSTLLATDPPMPDDVRVVYTGANSGDDQIIIRYSLVATRKDNPESFNWASLQSLNALLQEAENRLRTRAAAATTAMTAAPVTSEWNQLNDGLVSELADEAVAKLLQYSPDTAQEGARSIAQIEALEVAGLARGHFVDILANALRQPAPVGTRVSLGLSSGHRWTVGRRSPAKRLVVRTLEIVAGHPAHVQDAGDPDVQLSGDDLVLHSHGDDRAEAWARQLLGPPRRRTASLRVIDAWAPSDVAIWGPGAIAIFLAAAGLSPVPLGPVVLVLLPLFCLVIFVAVIGVCRRRGARVGVCMLGIAAPLALGAFATAYGWLMLAGSDIRLVGGNRLHLVDPLLMSVGVAVTDGSFDYQLHGYVARLLVLLEMLLLVSIAGSSVVAVTRRVLQSLREAGVQAEG